MKSLTKKILLVNPPRVKGTPAIRLNRCEVLDKLTLSPPLDLAYFYSIVREVGDEKDIFLLDANGLDWGIKKVKRVIKNFQPDVVITKCLLNTLKYDLKVLKVAKEIDNNIVTIASSITALDIEKYILQKYPYVDFFARGEIDAFAKDIYYFKPEHFKKIKGLVSKGTSTSFIRIVKKLDELPFPSWDALPDVDYVAAPGIKPWGMIIASRGCPFHCTFCTIGGNKVKGFKWRYRKPDNVANELEMLIETRKIKSFAFFDETFNIPFHCEGICKEIIRRNIELPWFCEGRVDLVNRKTLKLMARAGCVEISYGIETPDERGLLFSKKGIQLKDILRAFRLTEEYGIKPSASLILGFPSDCWRTFFKIIKLLVSINAHYVSLSLLVPYPATEIFDELKEKGLIVSYNWEEYDQTLARAVIRTEHLTPTELGIMRKLLYRIWGIIRTLKNGRKDVRSNLRYIIGPLKFYK